MNLLVELFSDESSICLVCEECCDILQGFDDDDEEFAKQQVENKTNEQ